LLGKLNACVDHANTSYTQLYVVPLGASQKIILATWVQAALDGNKVGGEVSSDISATWNGPMFSVNPEFVHDDSHQSKYRSNT
jgi:hypothetical protein